VGQRSTKGFPRSGSNFQSRTLSGGNRGATPGFSGGSQFGSPASQFGSGGGFGPFSGTGGQTRFDRRGRPWNWLRRRWSWLSSGGGGSSADTTWSPASIASAQACLAQTIGSWVPQTGRMGPATRRAVRLFQKRQRLTVTGVIDQRTMAAIRSACGGGAPPPEDTAPPPEPAAEPAAAPPDAAAPPEDTGAPPADAPPEEPPAAEPPPEGAPDTGLPDSAAGELGFGPASTQASASSFLMGHVHCTSRCMRRYQSLT